MSALTPVPINPPPGVVVTETARVAVGRWILPFDKIRFRHGRPEKVGGSTRISSTAMSGTPRATLCWQDFLQNGYIACGTFRKLYAFDNALTLTDITPLRATGTLPTNPFTTQIGSNSVTVTQVANGVNVGDTVIFAGAATFNNVTMNGTFVCATVVTVNQYTVTAATTANASSSGGGAAVTFQYEVPIGTELGAFGQGWGTGPWGLGTWGTARGTSIVFFSPRVWSLEHFGQILVATYNGGSLWFFDPTQSEPWPRAVATFNGNPVNGAPTNIQSIFISPERFIFALSANMVVNVSSQGDPTTWTPATSNTAFARTLQIGSKLVAGRALAPFISMVWSDNAAYLFQYTGSQFLYNSSLAGRDCGLIGPQAALTVDGVAYWMGPDNFYTYNGGSVSTMPNVEDIRTYVFNNLPGNLGFQCSAIYVAKYHEIWWFYPTTGSTNPTNYVIFHINDQCWSVGTGNFYSSVGVTACPTSGSHFSAGDTSPIMPHNDGYLYNHDPVSLSYDDNGQPMTVSLTLSPYAMDEGLKNVDLEAILFDFFLQTGAITATVNTFDRLTDAAPEDTQTISYPATGGGLTDFRLHGRYLALSMTQSLLGGFLRFGRPIAWIKPAGTRR